LTNRPDIRVIIPAYNEAQAIALVIEEIPKDLVAEIIVVDNASTDRTGAVAASAGATVLLQPQKGYGNACLKGIAYLQNLPVTPDLVVFLDGDHSDYPEEMRKVVAPVLAGEADMVIGSRALGKKTRGSMTPQQIFGNWLATRLLWWFYRARFTDLGPFRAIRYQTLLQLGMVDQNYGWTVEMQIKAAQQKVRFTEVPVNYRERIGQSKVSGTVKGTVMAGYKILLLLFKYAILQRKA
jgi:glycosyltransferase involved in cell wall biosynthesis